MKKRIYTRIFGGLGNQLFIYAFAKALSSQKKIPLILDSKSGFLRDVYKRSFKLKNFNIPEKESGFVLFLYNLFRKRLPIASKLLKPGLKYIKETDSRQFEPIIFSNKLGNYLYFEGYWQSYKYFEAYEEEIRKNLVIKKPMTAYNKELGTQIKQKNSVAIHLRRVDYSPVLDIKYYLDAMEWMKRNIENPEFFVFSDDMDFCKQHFEVGLHVSYIDHNGVDEIADFYLMTRCKHFIIANSSFSWWAAWLSENTGKQVIAPNSIHIGVKDNFYPESWIRM